MLTHATIDGLRQLRLHAMAAALADQNDQASYTGLGSDERLGLLAGRNWPTGPPAASSAA
jgi:hypothetical protein